MRRNALARAAHHKRSLKQVWQLGDVARYAPSFIESQPVGSLCIVRIGMAVDISDCLFVAVYDLKAAVYRLNGPWWWSRRHE